MYINQFKSILGGLNTPLVNADFSTTIPTPNIAATPNTVLATPFRSQRSDTSSAPFSTPGSVGQKNAANAAQIAVRDKLNINDEETMEVCETPIMKRQVFFIYSNYNV